METISRPPVSVQFENFEFDLRTRELRRNGVKLKIRGHPVEVLAILLECPAELVSRDTLQKRLWPDDTFVAFEQILNNSIGRLREALGDSAENPKYIETLPRLGYRFIAPVNAGEAKHASSAAVNAGAASDPLPHVAQPRRSIAQKWILGSALALVALITLIGYRYVRTPLPAPAITHYEQLTLDGRVKHIRGTDGPRLYIESRRRIYQLPISGGALSEIPFDFPPENGSLTAFWDVSPNGSSFLVGNEYLRLEGYKLWAIGALGRPARFLARAVTAAWSPDGKTAIYITSHGDVYTVDVANGEPRLLMRQDSPETQTDASSAVAWSPDGKTIRFTRSRRSKILEMRSDGSNFHEFLPGWRGGIKKCCGRWTPDGNFFLFLAGGDLDKGPTFSPLAQIWAVDERRGKLHPPNPEPILLASGPLQWGPPLPSRDSKAIFARGVSMRGELNIYNRQSNRFEPYLNGISAEMPDFSRDGKYVAYVSFPDGILWRANRDGSAPLQLTHAPYYPRNPRWSPDGKTILFTDNTANGIDRLYVISSQGGEPKRVLPALDEPQSLGDWSPDGSKLVYSTHPGFSYVPFDTSKIDTRIHDLATGKSTTLPRRPEGFWSPLWSPDGRYIAGQRFDAYAVLVFDLVTQRWMNFDLRRRMSFHHWSHDGKFIYFLFSDKRDQPAISRFQVPSGKEEAVFVSDTTSDIHVTGWYGGWMSLDPDDVPLLFRDLGTNEIYALTLGRK